MFSSAASASAAPAWAAAHQHLGGRSGRCPSIGIYTAGLYYNREPPAAAAAAAAAADDDDDDAAGARTYTDFYCIFLV